MLTLEDIKEVLTVAQYNAFIENVNPTQLPRLERMYDVSEAISSLIQWHGTEQKFKFWCDLYKQLRERGL